MWEIAQTFAVKKHTGLVSKPYPKKIGDWYVPTATFVIS